MKCHKIIKAAALGLILFVGTQPALAEKYRAATWNAAGSPVEAFLTDFADLTRKNTKGNLDFEVFAGGTLLPAKGTLAGLNTGVAHLANITGVYYPAELPVDFVLADLSFIADDQLALAFAKTEVTFFNPQIQEELHDKDVVFATGFTIGIYTMVCGIEATKLEDFKGKKIRTASDAQIGFSKAIGGVAVSVPGSEIYTGIQRGSVDCTTGTPLYLTEFYNMADVTKSIYNIPLGSLATGGYYFNQKFWKERTLEERRDLLKSLSRATARSMIGWGKRIDHAWDVAKENNVIVTEPEPEAMETLNKFKNEFISNLAKTSMEKREIKDPTELINQMVNSMNKWKKLLAGVDRTNEDKITALLDREIFDKIDVSKYGVN